MTNKTNRVATIDLITRYINALESGDLSDSLFTPDVTLSTPFLEIPVTGREEVMDALKEISRGVDNIKILSFLVEGQFACAVIEFKSKKGITVEMCDTYRISNGRLAEMHPYFDPRPLIGDK
jgi:hypothetical protein